MPLAVSSHFAADTPAPAVSAAGTDDNANNSAANNCGDHDTRQSMRLSEPDFLLGGGGGRSVSAATMGQLRAAFLNVGDPTLISYSPRGSSRGKPPVCNYKAC